MGEERAASISIPELQAAIKLAAGTHSNLVRGDLNPVWLRDPGLLGIILKDVDFGLSFKDAHQVSVDIAGNLGRPASIFVDNNLLVGLIPFENKTTFTF